MLEVGGVHRARRPQHDRRLVLGCRRDRPQRVEQQRRVVVDGTHAMAGEQLGHQSRHRDPVLDHVRDPRRSADVVLEHAPAAVAVSHEVAAADVAVDAAGRADAVDRPRELLATDDQRPRHDPRLDDLVRVVDVVDERVQRPDPLRQAALDDRPLGAGQHPRHEVQRPGTVTTLAIGARHLERDPLLHEDRVAALAGGAERLRTEAIERGHQRPRVRQRPPTRVEQLVDAALRDRVSGGDRRHRLGFHLTHPTYLHRLRACVPRAPGQVPLGQVA